ncbi:hypothetical protein SAMN04487906_0414 [Zhouia amylolytica]|uniref:Protein involved in gliding motility SprE n=1 Tax=Zhouia amylolytica TaxID=376730 RepID=A0A1I6PPX5_9FLAO|nr:hypothetical protein [Zhouia amylolytica]SFS42244.1 hypothetical protein SAMN04487906_0414 [Zhouia amylolytica]
MKYKYIIYPLSLLLLCTFGCSTKKDAFVNRNWHALNAEFNTIYNGQLALDKGVELLKENYRDNYWEILPVERMEIIEEVRLSGSPINPNFERAEEKAVKAIQKHGMYIDGQEKNTQSDEAYLLLGKARYYDQRFVPALEAFNYILSKYTRSDIINQAKIWREKTNIRMEYEELALKNFKRLLRSVNIKDQDYADIYAIMGQAYINLEQKDSAVQKLKLASNYTRSNEERGRYNFIIGQLYNAMGYKDSANLAFDKVIDLNRRTSRDYYINAFIEKIKNIEVTPENEEAVLELLKDLEKNRENRPYLDKIYHQLAMYYLDREAPEVAEYYFNKSLRTDSPDKILNAINYETLAEINFDNHEFAEAGAYYDSTLTNIEATSKKFRILSKKRENLDDVIKYEGILARNDSILYVVNLPQEERDAYYQKHIDSLKAIEIEKEEQERIAALREAQNKAMGLAGRTFKSSDANTFYFYNDLTVSYGRNEFRKRWGARGLEDNWRLSDRAIATNEVVVNTQNRSSDSLDIYSIAYYTDRLPKEDNELDSIHSEQNFAYYQLGLIYKEKFREYGLAVNRLESLLGNNPEDKLVLPAKYNLYKIYEINDSPLAQRLKNDIILNYPESRYARILENPKAVLKEGPNSPKAIYAKLYSAFEKERYDEVLAGTDKYITEFNGDEIVPKLAMLKATTEARLIGVDAYEQALNAIALNYPNNSEGKKAKELLETLVPRLKKDTLVNDLDTATKWKLVYPFASRDTSGINELYKVISKSLIDLEYDELKLSTDLYDSNQTFVVVHGLISKLRAEGFAELLKINKLYLIQNENFVISASNYKSIQIHKSLEKYLTQIYNNNQTPY